MRRTCLLACLVAVILPAQTSSEKLRNVEDVLKIYPKAMPDSRIFRAPHATLPGLLSKPQRIFRVAPPSNTGVCSIPLLQIPGKSVDEKMAIHPPGRPTVEMPSIQVPAPPCKDWPAK